MDGSADPRMKSCCTSGPEFLTQSGTTLRSFAPRLRSCLGERGVVT